MTTPTPCVRLPFLRGPLSVSGPEDADAAAVSAAHPGAEAALLLWPGLPQAPLESVYCPPNYPFSQRQAAACLEDLRLMGDAALSGLPVGATAAANPRAARRASEMALLRELGGADNEAALKAEAARKLRIELEQAQKALLWTWLQEERMAELAELARAFAQKSGTFTRSLGVADEDADALGASNDYAGAGILGAPVSLDLGLMPPWRLVVANAMYFLPPDMPILAEGPMAEDLQETLDFAHAASAQAPADVAHASLAQAALLCARAPAWRAMGRSRPTGAQPLDAERQWFVRAAS